MLAPDDLDPVIGALNGFHANVRAAYNLSTMFKSLSVYPMPREAQWIIELRQHAAELDKTGESWKTCKLSVLPEILPPITNYYRKFKTVRAYLPQVEDGKTAAALLDRLIAEIDKNVKQAARARGAFENWVNDAMLNLHPLNDCVTKAWNALGASEKKIVALSEQIVRIQNSLANLDGVISISSISSGTIASAQTILSNTASMVYTVAIAGGSLPVLGVGVTFFTVGKLFFDIFRTAGKLEQELENLKTHGRDLNLEQQSLAQTKTALMYVYDMKAMLEKQGQTLREMEAFWQNELRAVKTVRDNFALAEHYTKENPEVWQLEIAESVWFSLSDKAKELEESIGRPADSRTKIKFAL